MNENQNVESSIEVALSEFNYWYEAVLLDLITDRPVTSPLNDDVLLDIKKNLKKFEQDDSVKQIMADKSELDSAVLKIINLSDSDDRKVTVQGFMDIYRRMTSHMRAYIKNNKDGSVLDLGTGLQRQSELPASYKVEMERLNRHKEPFTLCLMRCDPIWHKDTTKTDEVFKLTSEIVLGNLRVFDDAYRWNNDYILVFLKHTKDAGGAIFYERVQRQFDALDEIDGAKLSTSACIAAPFEGKRMEELLSEMKTDLDVTCKDVRDDYITIAETTDLQKFLGGSKQKDA